MARVALIFLFAFCVFHLSAGARIVRDAESEEPQKVVEDITKNLGDLFKKVFSQENVEKMQNDAKKLGETLMAQGQALKAKAEQELAKLNQPEQPTKP